MNLTDEEKARIGEDLFDWFHNANKKGVNTEELIGIMEVLKISVISSKVLEKARRKGWR